MASQFSGGIRAHAGTTARGVPQVDGHLEGKQILVPVLTTELPALSDQLNVAIALARATDGSLTVVRSLSIPEQPPPTENSDLTADDDLALLNWVFDQDATFPAAIDGTVLHTRDVVTGVLQAVRTRGIDTLVIPGRTRGRNLRTGVTEQIAAHADADVVVVNGQTGFETTASILLPVAGGPHSGLAADVATSIAVDCDAWIDILHVLSEDASDRRRSHAQSLVDAIYRRIGRPETTTTWVLEATDTTEAIIEQSQYYALTIIGAPTKGRLRRIIFGSTSQSVRSRAGSVVLSTRNNRK